MVRLRRSDLSTICRRHVFAQYDPAERRQEALLLVNRGKSASPSYTSREGSARLPAVGRFLGQSRDRDAHAASVLGPDHTEEFRLQDRHQFGSWQSRARQSTCQLGPLALGWGCSIANCTAKAVVIREVFSAPRTIGKKGQVEKGARRKGTEIGGCYELKFGGGRVFEETKAQ